MYSATLLKYYLLFLIRVLSCFFFLLFPVVCHDQLRTEISDNLSVVLSKPVAALELEEAISQFRDLCPDHRASQNELLPAEGAFRKT